MLTKKQLELRLFIDEHLKSHGTAPSFEEMKMAINLKSKSGIHRLVTALEERGFLRRLPHRARALEITKLPSSHHVEIAEPENRGFHPSVIEGDFSQNRGNRNVDSSESVSLPLYGRIAAGMPIEALRPAFWMAIRPSSSAAKLQRMEPLLLPWWMRRRSR